MDLPESFMPPVPVESEGAESFEGTILEDALPGEPVRVRIPDLSNELVTDPCPWIPVTRAEGIFYPHAGDECVVVQPPQGNSWIASWAPSASVPDAPIGGGSYTAGPGLLLDGDEFSADFGDGSGEVAEGDHTHPPEDITGGSDGQVLTKVAGAAAWAAAAGGWGNIKIASGPPSGGVEGDFYSQIDSATVATEIWMRSGGVWFATGLPLFDVSYPSAPTPHQASHRPGGSDPILELGSYVTSLPGSPVDGQEVYFDTGQAGVIWHLRYRSGASGSYKWEFLGGPPLVAASNAARSLTNQTTYTNLPTDPLSITLPLAGDFDIKIESQIQLSGSAGIGRISYSTNSGGSNAVNDWGGSVNLASGQYARVTNETRQTGLMAGSDIAEKALTGGSYQVNFDDRRLSVRPVRVG